MKYDEVLPIKSCPSTAWLVEFGGGQRQLCVWPRDTKIEDVVKMVKNHYPTSKFTVSAVDTGVFALHHTEWSMTNGRKLNQDMEVTVG